MELMRCSSSTLNRLPFCCRGTTINHLPDALLIEIFLRLPLKSAKLCTVVSKHWYDLISTSDFGNRFLQLNYDSTLLISHHNNSRPPKYKLFISSENSAFRSNSFSMSNLPYKPPIAVVGSCGDLLLLCPDTNLHSVYYICNPLTAKWFPLLPAPTHPHQVILKVHTGFIFQGQGISFKYAVVRVPLCDIDDGGGAIKFEFFTSDFGIWSEKVWNLSSEVPGFYLRSLVGVPYNGMLFWISDYDVDDDVSHILVGVDPFSESEPLHFKVLPCSPPKFYGSEELAVSRGILKLLVTDMNDTKNELSIHVWGLQDFVKNEWYLMHHISFSGLESEYPQWFGDYPFVFPVVFVFPLACDGDIMYIMVNFEVVLLCNMRKKTLDVIHDELIPGIIGAFIYVLPWQPTTIPSLLN